MIEAFFETWFESVRERRSLPASDRLATEEPLRLNFTAGRTLRLTVSLSLIRLRENRNNRYGSGFPEGLPDADHS